MATSLLLRRACFAAPGWRRGLAASAPALREWSRACSAAGAPAKTATRSPPTYTRTTSYAADIEDVLAISSEKMQSWIRGHKTTDGGGRSSHVAWGKILDQAHVVKTPSDSLLTVELPFGRDPAFRARYLNFRNHLRVGRLLEELDAFAGHLAYRHCEPPEGSDSDPPILVTVSTDRVDLLQYPLPADRDMIMTGMVTYVGASSLNIDIDMSLVGEPSDAASAGAGVAGSGAGVGGGLVPVLQASFTFVARDTNNKAVKVPRLEPRTPFEVELFKRGKEAQEQRKAARMQSLYTLPPLPHELESVHALFQEIQRKSRINRRTGDLELLDAPPAAPPAPAATAAAAAAPAPASAAAAGCTSAAAPRVMFMEDTRMSTMTITQPQERNLHGKVFGGLLMRRAFELAWACGWEATGVVPKFLALDDIFFLHPVEVGALLRFEAQIDYALGPPNKTYSVSVSAIVRPPTGPNHELGAERVTNTFHFTFYTDEPERLPRVYPRTYDDAIKHLEAARRMSVGRALAMRRKAEGIKPRFE